MFTVPHSPRLIIYVRPMSVAYFGPNKSRCAEWFFLYIKTVPCSELIEHKCLVQFMKNDKMCFDFYLEVLVKKGSILYQCCGLTT